MSGKPVRAVFLAPVLIFLICVPGAFAEAESAGRLGAALQALLSSADSSAEIPILVSLSDRWDAQGVESGALKRSEILLALREHAIQSQSTLITQLRKRGAKRLVPLWIHNGIALTAKRESIRWLSKDPRIRSIRLDRTFRLPVETASENGVVEWNLAAIGANELWLRGHTGEGVVVAGVDSGVDALHPDLAAAWRGGANSWFDPNGEHEAPADADGHGTQTMGLMVGGAAGGLAVGVAPGAQWIAVKIFNDAGEASLSSVHMGYQWLADPDGDPETLDAPHIINNSWGLTENLNECVDEFQEDIRVLRELGIVSVFAAGNAGPYDYTSVSPGNYPESMAVGALGESLSLLSASSRGPSSCDGGLYPALAAPGEGVRTTDLTLGGVFPSSYVHVSGTSFAAPHLAGAMALLLSAFPDLSIAELEFALRYSAMDLGEEGPDNAYGHGLVDVSGAFSLISGMRLCNDADGDGYYSGTDCGTDPDCDDTDPLVYPGSPEINGDGLDQDCNGYDLTIRVPVALKLSRLGRWVVVATSAYGPEAALQVIGYGPMRWFTAARSWVFLSTSLESTPDFVTVSGVEGAVAVCLNAR